MAALDSQIQMTFSDNNNNNNHNNDSNTFFKHVDIIEELKNLIKVYMIMC